MVFWCRISRSRLDCLSYQWKRWYFQVSGINLANYISGGTTIRAWQKPNSPFSRRPAEMYETVRFFAAPVLAKPKPVEKDSHGPRINNQITAEFVRLVTDEGHAVVSKREALERARKLKLDLVEVQRTAKPPVCKIMDFHKEKYKQQLKEKDRSKGKSEVTLRKGDCKEVRFSGKTEQKDLQMKADTVKRLMERGYRVKCMAMGTEDQDLGGLLSRLSALIEDVSIVESGPRVEKRQAYVIVRHIKFGLSKKGPGKKAAKVVEATSTDVQKAATSPPTINSSSPIPSPLYIEDYKPAESGLETEVEIITDLADLSIDTPMEMPGGYIEQNKVAWSTFDASDDFEKVFDFNNEENGVASSPTDAHMDSSVETVFHQGNVDTTDFLCPNQVAGSVKAAVLSSPAKPSLEGEKMYSKSEPKSRFRPTKSTQSTFPENKMFSELSKFSSAQRSQVNRGSSTMDSVRLGPQLPNQGRQQQSAVNAFPSTEKRQFGIDGSSLRNLRCPSVDGTQKQDQSRPCTQSSPASNFGIFSAPKPAAPRKEGAAMEGNRDKERSSYDSTKSQNSSRSASDPMSPTSNAESSQKPDANKPKQGGWGIFSRDTSTLNQSRISDSCKVQR